MMNDTPSGEDEPTGAAQDNESSVGQTITFDESLEIFDRIVGRMGLLPTLQMSSRDAAGLTLAADAVSRLDLPPFNKAAMDGYAIAKTDDCDTFDVIEEIPAGCAPTRPVGPGQATRIMTGAPVPEGTERVVPWENTDNGRERVKINRLGGKTNICVQGEDVRTGDVVYRPGQPLDAIAIASLLGCGISEVSVFRRTRISILATGSELADDPAELRPGMIIDTNGPMLAALASENGIEVAQAERVADDLDATVDAIRSAEGDFLILTGGVSAGDYDFVAEALTRAGYTIRFNSVSVQPGNPLTLADTPDRIALGLPGNPVSVLNSFYHYLLRGIAIRTGRAAVTRSFKVELADDYSRRRARRTALVPCTLDEQTRLHPIEYHGSAHLHALSKADGVMLIPKGIESLPAGTKVRFFPRF